MKAEIRVMMADGREAEAMLKSISVDSPARSKSEVGFAKSGSTLILSMNAVDVGALRAAFNSYVRQVKIASDALNIK